MVRRTAAHLGRCWECYLRHPATLLTVGEIAGHTSYIIPPPPPVCSLGFIQTVALLLIIYTSIRIVLKAPGKGLKAFAGRHNLARLVTVGAAVQTDTFNRGEDTEQRT